MIFPYTERTERLLGDDAMKALAGARVIVFGLGGVGGFCAEALCRAGVGALDLVDHDVVSESNLNRQLIALRSTVGQKKTDVLAARLRDVNPDVKITVHDLFFSPETESLFDFSLYDYAVDAIDTVAGKVSIIRCAKAAGIPVISVMGAGNKLDPLAFRVTDVEKTDTCPLAKAVRVALRREGIRGVKAVWSRELPLAPAPSEEPQGDGKRITPGSVSFVPPVAGLIAAGEVVRDLCGFSRT